jgi:hypothetical protein
VLFGVEEEFAIPLKPQMMRDQAVMLALVPAIDPIDEIVMTPDDNVAEQATYVE